MGDPLKSISKNRLTKSPKNSQKQKAPMEETKMSKDKPENLKDVFGFSDLKIITPTYSIELMGDNFVIVEASSSKVDTEKGIVTFQSGDSVNAMFRLEDVKEFWRVV
jgi:hypothetical protein